MPAERRVQSGRARGIGESGMGCLPRDAGRQKQTHRPGTGWPRREHGETDLQIQRKDEEAIKSGAWGVGRLMEGEFGIPNVSSPGTDSFLPPKVWAGHSEKQGSASGPHPLRARCLRSPEQGVRFRSEGFQDLRRSRAGAWVGYQSCEPGLSPSWGTQRQLLGGVGVGGPDSPAPSTACGTTVLRAPTGSRSGDPRPLDPLGTRHRRRSADTPSGARGRLQSPALLEGGEYALGVEEKTARLSAPFPEQEFFP